MMKKIVLFFSCCLVLGLMHHPQAFSSHSPCPPNAATAPVVTVVIGTETRTAADQVILNDANGAAHTYPNGLTIAPLVGAGTGGNAVVRVECDTAGDTLSLMNAKITVSAPVTNQVIQYWATFDKLPLPAGHNTASPQTMPDVWYKLTGAASGVIIRTGANLTVGDKIVAKGEILNPVPGTWKTIGSLTKTVQNPPPQSVPFFPNSLSWKYPPPLTGERHIRGTVTITLKNAADRMELGNGIVIVNSASACEDCDQGGGEQLSTWCMTTNSTAQALGCPSCLTEEGMVAENHKLHMFAKSNWGNLSQDIARGHGEHLASFAALLRVPAERRPAFFAYAQDQYQHVIREGGFGPNILIGALQRSEEVPPRLASRESDLTSQ
jgi:hypothetical protein